MKRIIVVALIGIAGCDDHDARTCPAGTIDGRIVTTMPSEPPLADFTLRGTLNVPADVTVYGINVNGAKAVNDGTNFDHWTVTLPLSLLANQAVDGMVTLAPVVYSNCADAVALGTQTIPVDDTPAVAVNAINIAVSYPNGQTFLPATAPVSADLLVTANKEALGATVSLTTTAGMLASSEVTLTGDGNGMAAASVRFTSATPGVALVRATAKGRSGSALITVAGPPVFSIASATLQAGNRVTLTANSPGRITRCQATPATGLRVLSGTNDLMTGTTTLDQPDAGRVNLSVAVDGALTAAAETRVSCHDAFDQVAEAVFRGERQTTTPAPVVTSVAVVAAPVNGQSYLPSSQPVQTILTITGNAESAGAVVSLTSTLGTLAPAQVTLANNGTSPPTAYALFSSSTPGHATITATSAGRTGVVTIPIVAAPSFAPDGTAIPAGQARRVTVLRGPEATVAGCQATPAAGIHVTSGAADLMAGVGGVDLTLDGLIDIDIAIEAASPADARTIVTCRDPFGQVATAAYSVAP